MSRKFCSAAAACAMALAACSDSPEVVADGTGRQGQCVQRFAAPKPPQAQAKADVLVVLDNSGSMEAPLADGSIKYRVMWPAVERLVREKQTLAFGLLVFGLDYKVVIDINQRSADPIAAALRNTRPVGGTPTAEALNLAREHFGRRAASADRPRVVLLATDGAPDDLPRALQAVTDLENAGVTTYVLGFGMLPVDADRALEEMARLGGTERAYHADNAQNLANALNTVGVHIEKPPCTLPLGATPVAERLRVTVGGEQAPPMLGFSYDAVKNEVTLLGRFCERVQAGQGNVTVDFGWSFTRR